MKPKILIVVSGGVVQDIQASEDMDVYLIDHDNLKAGDSLADARTPGPPYSIGDIEQSVAAELADYRRARKGK